MTEKEMWFNAVSIENNEQYVTSLLRKFKIEEYNVIYGGGILSLLFKYKTDSYRCDIDKENMKVVLLKRNLCGNSRKDKFHKVKSFGGLDCFYEIIKFVVKGNKSYGNY